MTIKWNKWEWSELYVFLKLLMCKKLDLVDAKLDKIGIQINIPKMVRYYKWLRDELEYDGKIVTIIHDWVSNSKEINISEQSLLHILEDIIQWKGASFPVPSLESIINILALPQIKSDSYNKTDIFWMVYEDRINWLIEHGFSVKSNIKADSTLLNASKENTNFKYKIIWLTKKQVDYIFSETCEHVWKKIKSEPMKVIKMIYQYWWKIEFIEMKWKTFENNLKKIDFLMPEIISKLLLGYYSSKWNKINELIQNEYNGNEDIDNIKYKVTKSLIGIWTVIMTNKERNWYNSGSIWFIVLSSSWELKWFYTINDNELWKYLLHTTRFDTPSTKRHMHGFPYSEDDCYFIDLNCQIRFFK